MKKLKFLCFVLFLLSCNKEEIGINYQLIDANANYYYLVSDEKVNEIRTAFAKRDSIQRIRAEYGPPIRKLLKKIAWDYNNQNDDPRLYAHWILTNDKEDIESWSDVRNISIDNMSDSTFNIYGKYGWYYYDSLENKIWEDTSFYIRTIPWRGVGGILEQDWDEGGYGEALRGLKSAPGFELPTEQRTEREIYFELRKNAKSFEISRLERIDSTHPGFKWKSKIYDLQRQFIAVEAEKKRREEKSKLIPRGEVQRDLERQYIIHSSKDLGDTYLFLAIPYGTSNEGCIIKVSASSGKILRTDCGTLQNASFTFDQY